MLIILRYYLVCPLFINRVFIKTSICFAVFQAELIDPAVKGTLNVLKSCTKVQSIKRVVITSSIATVMFDRKPQTPDVVVDETWHSDPAVCKEMKVFFCANFLVLYKLIYFGL